MKIPVTLGNCNEWVFQLSMKCYWSTIVSGDLVLKEHEAARWLTKDELFDVDWLPADIGLVEKIKEVL